MNHPRSLNALTFRALALFRQNGERRCRREAERSCVRRAGIRADRLLGSFRQCIGRFPVGSFGQDSGRCPLGSFRQCIGRFPVGSFRQDSGRPRWVRSAKTAAGPVGFVPPRELPAPLGSFSSRQRSASLGSFRQDSGRSRWVRSAKRAAGTVGFVFVKTTVGLVGFVSPRQRLVPLGSFCQDTKPIPWLRSVNYRCGPRRFARMRAVGRNMRSRAELRSRTPMSRRVVHCTASDNTPFIPNPVILSTSFLRHNFFAVCREHTSCPELVTSWRS